MSVFGFLFYIGIINIIFNFFWKWVFVLPMAFILTITKLDKYGIRAVKIFGAYLLVSLVAILTLVALGDEPSGFAMVYYPIVGIFVLLMGFASSQYEARKEAHQTYNWELMQMLEENATFELFLMLGAVVFYVLALFAPALSANTLTHWLFSVIDWAYNLPIIGLLIGIGGLFFLLNTVFYGLFAVGGIAVFAYSKIRGEKPAEPQKVAAVEETAKLL